MIIIFPYNLLYWSKTILGSGKTTLAHVIAKHCGYHALEINASDDRSADVLRDRLTSAMVSNETLLHGLPNCLILDEIDGIDSKAAVNVLIKMAMAPLQGKQSHLAIRRPMICICNDAFVPALRELKKHCQIFHLPPPSSPRLLQRLKYVCQAEGLPISSNALSELITSCGMDIRSALHTLQFISMRCNAVITTATTTNNNDNKVALENILSRGIKDSKRDVFKLWRSILSASDLQLNRKATPSTITQQTSNLSWLIHEISEFNDYQQILNGVYEHMLLGSYHEVYMSKTSAALDWISSGDVFEGAMKRGSILFVHSYNITIAWFWLFLGTSSDYGLLDYQPYMMGAVHLLCSSTQRVKVNWPKKVSIPNNKLLLSIYSNIHLRTMIGMWLRLAMIQFCSLWWREATPRQG